MKRFLLTVLLMLMVALPALCEDVQLMVATDLHYLAPELTDHGPYFHQKTDNSDGKVMLYIEELLEAFVWQVTQRKPDALILSGDLTFNGEKLSHEALAEKLTRIEQAGIPVLVIPGNHDLNNGSAIRYAGEGYERVDSVTMEDFRAIYHPFGYEEAMAQDADSLSYVVQMGEGMRLLMVDANSSYPRGEVKAGTLVWVEEQLAQAKQDGQRVIAVSHQNLHPHNDMNAGGYILDNAYALVKLYHDAPVLCNLSGHIHVQHMRRDRASLWDIATSSLAVAPNQYGVLTLTADELTYRTEPLDVSAWAVQQGLTDPNLLTFAAYAEDYFKTNARRQARGAVVDDEQPEELVESFAAINAAYFAGQMDQCPVPEDIVARWQQQPAMTRDYINSMLEDMARSQCELTLPLTN
ncbi:MAG: metallophosphoesterase [Aristaeellaceae bacterium]